MRPDVIVAWPESCDYPLWRQFIRDNRSRFAKVIVAFTAHPGPNYTEFVREAMAPDDVTWVDARHKKDDWRDVAVNFALRQSDAEWVWFTEQDFFITDERFWILMDIYAEGADAIGWHENGEKRFHPSCLFVRRATIDRSTCEFGVTEDGDHFAKFSRQIPSTSLLLNIEQFEHLQGVSHNHWLIDSGQGAGRFKMERFDRYLADCLEVTVPLDPDWAERSRNHLRSQAA
jgi:hypothetical protein